MNESNVGQFEEQGNARENRERVSKISPCTASCHVQDTKVWPFLRKEIRREGVKGSANFLPFLSLVISLRRNSHTFGACT